MADADFQGIPTTGEPGQRPGTSGKIPRANQFMFYDGAGALRSHLKSAPGPDGRTIKIPQSMWAADGAFEGKQIDTSTPQVVFGGDDGRTTVTSGWTAEGVYYTKGDKSGSPSNPGGPDAAEAAARLHAAAIAFTQTVTRPEPLPAAAPPVKAT